MYDKKSIRNSRKETIEIIVLTGPINFQINIPTYLGQKKTEIKKPKSIIISENVPTLQLLFTGESSFNSMVRGSSLIHEWHI